MLVLAQVTRYECLRCILWLGVVSECAKWREGEKLTKAMEGRVNTKIKRVHRQRDFSTDYTN